jgi:hypothetical protein
MATSKQLYANNAKAVLNATLFSADTTIIVDDGSKFPTPAAGEYFLVTLEYSGAIEIIKVTGKSGANLTGCVRAQEGTTAQGFPVGTRVECRVTASTLTSFTRLVDRMDELTTVDLLTSPATSNSNSYVCHSNDEVGNPIIALKNTVNTWRFSSHSVVKVAGALTSATNFSATSTSIGANIAAVLPGKYIIQFVTGANAGLCRTITSSSANVVSWATSLSVVPSAGDQFEIYKSNSSSINELFASVGVAPSDPTKADVNNTTLTGTTNVTGILQVKTQTDVKASSTANTATTVLDLSTANVFKVIISASTAFQFNNAPAGTNLFSFTLITINDATAGRAVSFPGSVTYAGGSTMPPRTTTANGRDVWTFFTDDAGATWVGSLAVNAY